MAEQGSAHNAEAMIQYQAEAVVSRIIIKKKTGSVTLFAFGQGQELSEHTTPYDALAHVIDGKAEISISGTPHALGAGDVLVMPANEPHAVKAVSNFKMLLTMIKE